MAKTTFSINSVSNFRIFIRFLINATKMKHLVAAFFFFFFFASICTCNVSVHIKENCWTTLFFLHTGKEIRDFRLG